MTQPRIESRARRAWAAAREGRLGSRAARILTTELARHTGPKTALLLRAEPGSPVLSAALAALRPGDSLALVPATGSGPELRAYLAAEATGPVRVLDALGEADPADVVLVGQVLTGTAEATRGYLEEVAKHIAEGGVLSVAVRAGAGFADGATDELDRQQAFSGAGADLVLLNRPPVRVHRLRYTSAPAATAGRLTPAYRPSSVPLTRGMNIDSNGVAAAAIALGLAASARLARPKSRLWLVPALAAVPVAAFFRDPRREPPADESAVLAASDGTVLSVEHLTDPRLGSAEWLRIAVFLSVLDVHVNRAPVAGRVVDQFVEDGGFAPAMKPDAEHNVAAYTVLETERGRVVVVQRTGLVARRIVHRAPVGSLLARGERFGLIRFGSRTDVYLPAGTARATVAPGDKVRGALTVIARWTD